MDEGIQEQINALFKQLCDKLSARIAATNDPEELHDLADVVLHIMNFKYETNVNIENAMTGVKTQQEILKFLKGKGGRGRLIFGDRSDEPQE